MAFRDLIIDEYIVREALGMSQEDPTVVFTPIDFKKFIHVRPSSDARMGLRPSSDARMGLRPNSGARMGP